MAATGHQMVEPTKTIGGMAIFFRSDRPVVVAFPMTVVPVPEQMSGTLGTPILFAVYVSLLT